jgi:hypothetical protein
MKPIVFNLQPWFLRYPTKACFHGVTKPRKQSPVETRNLSNGANSPTEKFLAFSSKKTESSIYQVSTGERGRPRNKSARRITHNVFSAKLSTGPPRPPEPVPVRDLSTFNRILSEIFNTKFNGPLKLSPNS